MLLLLKLVLVMFVSCAIINGSINNALNVSSAIHKPECKSKRVCVHNMVHTHPSNAVHTHTHTYIFLYRTMRQCKYVCVCARARARCGDATQTLNSKLVHASKNSQSKFGYGAQQSCRRGTLLVGPTGRPCVSVGVRVCL